MQASQRSMEGSVALALQVTSGPQMILVWPASLTVSQFNSITVIFFFFSFQKSFFVWKKKAMETQKSKVDFWVPKF